MIVDVPRDPAPPPAIVETMDAVLRRTTHQVTTHDGVQIAFDLYQQPGRDTVLIICPGFFQSKNTLTFRRLATELARERDVLCLDFRGHGDSTGLYTFGAREDVDLEAVLQWAQAHYPRVVLLGFSLGAATALQVASQHGGVQGLIAISAPATEQIEFRWWTLEGLRTGLEGLESRAGCRPGNPWLPKPRPIDAIPRLASIPILLIHGTRDRIILPQHSERLYAQATGLTQLVFVEGGGHAEALYRRDPKRFLTMVETWLATVNP